jgi:hypothetical protein
MVDGIYWAQVKFRDPLEWEVVELYYGKIWRFGEDSSIPLRQFAVEKWGPRILNPDEEGK